MTTSAHQGCYERFRQPLTLLTDDALLVKAITTAAADRSWWPVERHWLRRYGRFRPEQKSFALLVFETVDTPQELCQVEVFRTADDCRVDADAWTGDSAAGTLRIRRFPADSAMPGLPEILARAGRPRVVRYRPGRRCTIRFDFFEDGSAGYGKVFTDASGAAVHQAGELLWRAAKAGVLNFNVARPLRWESETHSVWQGSVPGISVKPHLFAPSGGALAFRMGQALATLPKSGLHSDVVFDAAVQLERSRRYADQLVQRVPELADVVAQIFVQIVIRHGRLHPRKLVPIHGAPHLHQWLVDHDRLGLVDFDRFSLGDPELDVATFIGELDFEDADKFPVGEINASFIAGYESVAGPLDHDLLALYRIHKRFAMACHAAQAVRPDGARRAVKRLRRAAEGLIDQSNLMQLQL